MCGGCCCWRGFVLFVSVALLCLLVLSVVGVVFVFLFHVGIMFVRFDGAVAFAMLVVFAAFILLVVFVGLVVFVVFLSSSCLR